MKTLLFILSLVFIFSVAELKAQHDGSLDLNFNKPIYINPPPQNGFIEGYVSSSIMLSTGKLLVYGHLGNYMNTTVHNLALLNTNGIIDSSFNPGIGPDPVFFDYGAHPEMICEQPDGKIIIVGSFTSYNGISQNRIVRIHPNGSIDSTFKIGSGANNRVFCVKLQGDGKIMVGGIFTVFNGLPASNLVRLNQDGSTDTSFNISKGFDYVISSGTQYSSYITTIEFQEDKILVGGFFNRFNDLLKNTMVRLNANGSLDNTLVISENMLHGTLQKIIYHPGTSRIYIGGYISDISGVVTTKVLRLYSDGGTDKTYNSPKLTGVDALSEINDFVLMPDGKLLVAGFFAIRGCNDLARFNPDGTCDTTFHFATYLYSNKVNSIVTSGTGEIYASGDFSWVNNESIAKGSIVKLLNTGETDLSFNPLLGSARGYSLASIELDNDSILIHNYDDQYNERPSNSFVKITPNGSVAYTNPYAGAVGAYDQFSRSLDGKFLCSSGGHTQKLNTDLSRDNTFLDMVHISTQSVSLFTGHAEQKDGKIIITGDFAYVLPYTNSRQCLQRLNADGTPDTTFKTGSGIAHKSNGYLYEDYYINVVQLLFDGRFLAGGYFNDYRGNTVSNIVCINPNGTFDPTMKFGTSFNGEVRKILIQSDSKIMVCGMFTEFSGTASNYIIRLNQDGSVDSSFISPFGKSDELSRITKIIMQADGKYLVAGTINKGTTLMRLNHNGTIDDSFYNTHNFGLNDIYNIYYQDRIHNINILRNGKILVQGYFDQIDSFERRGIALLNNTVTTSTKEIKANADINIYPNPFSDILYIKYAANPDKLEIFDLNGRILKSKTSETNWINTSNLTKGVYILKVFTSGKIQCLKVIRK